MLSLKFCVLGTEPRPLHTDLYVILSTAPGGKSYYSQFADEQTVALGGQVAAKWHIASASES